MSGTISAAVMVGDITAIFCASSSLKCRQFDLSLDVSFIAVHFPSCFPLSRFVALSGFNFYVQVIVLLGLCLFVVPCFVLIQYGWQIFPVSRGDRARSGVEINQTRRGMARRWWATTFMAGCELDNGDATTSNSALRDPLAINRCGKRESKCAASPGSRS